MVTDRMELSWMDLFDKPKEMFFIHNETKEKLWLWIFKKYIFSQAQIRFLTLLTPSQTNLKLLSTEQNKKDYKFQFIIGSGAK